MKATLNRNENYISKRDSANDYKYEYDFPSSLSIKNKLPQDEFKALKKSVNDSWNVQFSPKKNQSFQIKKKIKNSSNNEEAYIMASRLNVFMNESGIAWSVENACCLGIEPELTQKIVDNYNWMVKEIDLQNINNKWTLDTGYDLRLVVHGMTHKTNTIFRAEIDCDFPMDILIK